MKRVLVALAIILTLINVSAVYASSPVGRWDATIKMKDIVIPFRLDITGDGSNLQGVLFNGDEKQTTTSASLENETIVLSFEHYLLKITATVGTEELVGKVQGRFSREEYLTTLPFEAKRHSEKPLASEGVPPIGGLWEIEYNSLKGEKAWRLIVKQAGARVTASILRVDGDTGALEGSYQDGKFVLSHFDGSRPLVAVLTPEKDGTLLVELQGAFSSAEPLVAYRSTEARAKSLPEPANFTTNTTVKDPLGKFCFRFPDTNGTIISSDDLRFENKVIIAVITGTWCPNCHDEAPYLVELYHRYHDKGLEIVALDFEEAEQQGNFVRQRAFIKQYKIPYIYLIAGTPAELAQKIPQAQNLNSWPSTIFIGRDGRVKLIHSGFAASASGQFNSELKQEFTSTVERLLVEGKNDQASVKSK